MKATSQGNLTNRTARMQKTLLARPLIRRGWCFPSVIRSFGENLLGQQLWCWGRDIKHKEGNLLMRYGFQRHRQPSIDDREGSSCYRLDADSRHIALWGFGVFFGVRRLGGIFLSRFGFEPGWANVESISLGIRWPEELPVFGRPRQSGQWDRAHRLCREALRWISTYETWVQRTAGREFRERCVSEWMRPVVVAEKMASSWGLLRDRPWDEPRGEWREAIDRLTRDAQKRYRPRLSSPQSS